MPPPPPPRGPRRPAITPRPHPDRCLSLEARVGTSGAGAKVPSAVWGHRRLRGTTSDLLRGSGDYRGHVPCVTWARGNIGLCCTESPRRDRASAVPGGVMAPGVSIVPASRRAVRCGAGGSATQRRGAAPSPARQAEPGLARPSAASPGAAPAAPAAAVGMKINHLTADVPTAAAD